MLKVVRKVAAAVPSLRTRAWGVTTAPESSVPVGAMIIVTPTSWTRTVTEPEIVSLAGTMSPTSPVLQKVAKVATWSAVQVEKVTTTESPGPRLGTLTVSAQAAPMLSATGKAAAAVPLLRTRTCGVTTVPEST